MTLPAIPPGSQFNLFGDLSQPLVVLIEKISNALGGAFRPRQIVRVAQAEAQAEKIRAVGNIEIDELQRRALTRWVGEEAQKQLNIESITRKALPDIETHAPTDRVEQDWIAHFFDQCRLVSDEQMQTLWAKVLAGEANSPGSFSKRTMNLLGSLDKRDAEMFAALCGFLLMAFNGPFVILTDVYAAPYQRSALDIEKIAHLESLGLIRFDSIANFFISPQPEKVLTYFDKRIRIIPQLNNNDALDMGRVLLSQSGKELSRLCVVKPVDGFLEHLKKYWNERRFDVVEC